jgi:hypothetical protein
MIARLARVKYSLFVLSNQQSDGQAAGGCWFIVSLPSCLSEAESCHNNAIRWYDARIDFGFISVDGTVSESRIIGVEVRVRACA